jgi:hypothetical protein
LALNGIQTLTLTIWYLKAETDTHINFPMEILITGCWSLWEQRNDAIFKGVYPNIQRCIIGFSTFFMHNMHRAKPSLKEGMQSWLHTLWACNKGSLPHPFVHFHPNL